MNLRDRGIYRLPNGRELVALVSRGKPPLLHKLSESDRIQYALNEAGRLTFQGRQTAWSLEDLSDTGRTERNYQVAAERSEKSDLNSWEQPG